MTQTDFFPTVDPNKKKGGTVNWFKDNFQDIKVLAGIAALATLMGTGTVATHEGLPLLTGLIGLSINTGSSGTSSS